MTAAVQNDAETPLARWTAPARSDIALPCLDWENDTAREWNPFCDIISELNYRNHHKDEPCVEHSHDSAAVPVRPLKAIHDQALDSAPANNGKTELSFCCIAVAGAPAMPEDDIDARFYDDE
jgi:hypothetical protein